MNRKKIAALTMATALVTNTVITNTVFATTIANEESTIAKMQGDKQIINKSNVTKEQMEKWARGKGATETFISLAGKYISLAESHGGVDPALAYAQSAIETGYGKFGGLLDESYKNPCGFKKANGGSDSDPNAHQRFSSWDEGIGAHLDHLALYAGASGYPRAQTSDPRHFSWILGKSKTALGLSGTWATDKAYGEKIVRLSNEIENTEKPVNPPKPVEPPKPVDPPKPVPPKPSVEEKVGIVTASALNVRNGAGTNYKRIGGLKNGNCVTIVETKGNWYKIEYGSGYGYVSSDYIKIKTSSNDNSGNVSNVKEGKVIASILNVRSGAGTGNRIVGTIKRGQAVNIVETNGKWYKIKYGSGYGYVSSDYIKINTNGNTTITPNPNVNTGRVTASVLNVRSGAGTNNRVVGSLRNGTTVQIIESKNGWHKIKYGNGYGYISAQYVK